MNRCFCQQEAEDEARKLKYLPLGDETIYNLGAVYPHPGGLTPGPTISCLVWKDEGKCSTNKDSSSDEEHHPDPLPILTMGGTAATAPNIGRGWPATHQKQGMRNDHTSSPVLPGFVLNVHPNYIPFKLVDNKMGRQIPTK